MGLTDVERFSALPDESPIISFNASQIAMLKAFLATGKETLLVLEDDVVFMPDTAEVIKKAIGELPKHWEILYLGANLFANDWEQFPPAYQSPNLVRVHKAWTTHAIAYTRDICVGIIAAYNIIVRDQPNKIFDAFLSEEVLNKVEAYVVNPMIAWQRPDRSDLWNVNADYTDCFIKGNKLIQ